MAIDKFKSETFGLHSKLQLQAFRKQKWRALLGKNGLDKELIEWWTDDEKAIEAEAWKEADADYEIRKEALKNQLKQLDASTLEIYFNEIGVEPQDVDVWIKPSLVD